MFLLSFNWLLFLLVSLTAPVKGKVGKSLPNKVHFIAYPNHHSLDVFDLSAQASYPTELFPTERCNGLSPVPGITWMVRGVDITKLDLTPSARHPGNGFKNPLFDFTCTRNRTWSHPTQGQPLYALPDQIAAINTVPAGARMLNIKRKVNSNLKDVKESLGVSVGIDANLIVGSFSASVAYKEARENILSFNKSVLETSATVSGTQIDFDSSANLRPGKKFREMLASLPQAYETAPVLYDKFIETFGTHYFASAKFGGHLYQKTVIDNAYLFASSKKNIHANLKASFRSFVTASADVNVKGNTTDEAFQQKTQVDFYIFGGEDDVDTQLKKHATSTSVKHQGMGKRLMKLAVTDSPTLTEMDSH